MPTQSHAIAQPSVTQPNVAQPMAASTIDMVGPATACRMLQVSQAELLGLANSGELAAYDLGGHIRFRYRDVVSVASRRAIAA